jgi:transposase
MKFIAGNARSSPPCCRIAVARVLPKATVVLDKFHVLQHAAAALNEVRRQEFFRAGPVMRQFGRGKRWLLLRRWKTVRGSKLSAVREPI